MEGESSTSKRRKIVKNDETFKLLDLEKLEDDDFKIQYKISKETFRFVSGLLKQHLAPKGEELKFYSVDKRVGICLWMLANGESPTKAVSRFGSDRRTIRDFFWDVCQAIVSELKHKFLKWPDMEDKTRIASEFEKDFGIGSVLGSLYTTHIQITNRGDDFVGRFVNPGLKERGATSFSTIPVQGLVNSKGRFMDVYCCTEVGGQCTDEDLLKASRIEDNVRSGEIIVGGQSFVLRDWLLVPFMFQELTDKPELIDARCMFQTEVGKVIEIAREAFEELTGRWSYLTKQITVDLQKIPTIVTACCILQNICEDKKDKLNPELLEVVVNDVTPHRVPNATTSAISARDNIVKSLFDNRWW